MLRHTARIGIGIDISIGCAGGIECSAHIAAHKPGKLPSAPPPYSEYRYRCAIAAQFQFSQTKVRKTISDLFESIPCRKCTLSRTVPSRCSVVRAKQSSIPSSSHHGHLFADISIHRRAPATACVAKGPVWKMERWTHARTNHSRQHRPCSSLP